NGFAQRLLTVNVFASFSSGNGDQRVPMVRRRDHDCVDFRAGEQFAEILKRLTAFEGTPVSLLLVMRLDPFSAIFTPVGIHIANRHDLRFFSPKESAHEPPALNAESDSAKVDSVVRRGLRQTGGKNKRRGRY